MSIVPQAKVYLHTIPMWLLSPLSYPVPYVQMESTTQVTNVSFSYRTYQYQHMRTRQKRRKREKHIGSLYFEPSHHRHMGGKGENNMAPVADI